MHSGKFEFSPSDPKQSYDDNTLAITFLSLADKHAPVKKKLIKENQAPFMDREFQNEIHNKSKLRNKYWKQPYEENKIA